MNPPIDRTTKTRADGIYVFEDVPAGDGYIVEVIAENGKALGYDAPPTPFSVGKDDHLGKPIDITKGADPVVTKNAESILVTDRDTAQGANISNEQLRVLPLYNRTFLALSLIQPGVHDVEPGSPLQGAAFSIAGAHSTSTDFRLNSLADPDATGVNNVASGNNQAIPFQVNEAIQELRVVYAVPSVAYGQGTGGVIDIVTSQGHLSTGKKAWHGSAFGYFNDDAFNSDTPLSVYRNTTFAKASSSAYNPLGSPNSTSINYNTTYGGFFGFAPQSYNALYSLLASQSYTAPTSSSSKPVPTGALDTACHTDICGAGAFNGGTVLAGHDSHTMPMHQTQFGISLGGPLFNEKLLLFASYEGTRINNPTPIFERVPTSLDTNDATLQQTATGLQDEKIANGILRLFPNPNLGYGTANASGAGIFGFYRGSSPNYTNVHNIHIRPDLPLSTPFGNLGTLSLRYTGQLIDQLHDDSLPASGLYPGNGAYRRAQNQSASVAHNFTIHNMVNLLNLGFTQFRVDEVAQDRKFSISDLGTGPLSTFVLSGIDTKATGATPDTPGYMGGWYDSFWNVCNEPGGIVCGQHAISNSPESAPSAITPSLDGAFPLPRIGAPLSAPSQHRDTEGFLSDALSLHLGSRDSLIVGGEFRHRQNYSYDGGLARGLVVSNNIGEFTHDSETCISCGVGNAFTHPSFDYELRQPTGYTGDLRSTSFGIFAENKFQPNSQFTLSTGIRYDYFGQPLDTAGRLWNYSPDDAGLVRQGGRKAYDAFGFQCLAPNTLTTLVSFYSTHQESLGWDCNNNTKFHLPDSLHNITGRLGIAYSLKSDNKTVLRAAVGGYYANQPASYTQALLKNRPSPYDITNPSAIYGQNFDSSACSGASLFTQCALGLHTLNFNGPNFSADDKYRFDVYQAASGANILYQRDVKNLQTPYSIQFSGSVQHQFNSKWIAEAAYVGSVSQRLPAIYDGNFTNEFYCTAGSSSTAPKGVCNNNTFFPIFTESHIGASNYHSLILRITSQQWHGLSMHAAYTWSKSLDDVAGTDFPASTDSLWSQLFARQLFGMGNPVAFALGANYLTEGNGSRGLQVSQKSAAHTLIASGNIPSFSAIQSALTTTGSRPAVVSQYNIPQNPLSFTSSNSVDGGDYGRSDFDVNSRAVADFVYKTPTFGHKWLDGFLLSSILTAQTGQPFTVFSGAAYGQITQRISAVKGQTVKTTGNPNAYISGLSQANLASRNEDNLACTSLYAKGTLYNGNPTLTPQACVGNIGRNSFTGPAYISQDLALQKSFKLWRDHHFFDVRAEFFNLFNRSNYDNPISEFSQDGTHINPDFGVIRSAHDPREIQFAARYSF